MRLLSLRRTTRADLERLHALEVDQSSNNLAGTKPRDWATFLARWEQILADPDGSSTGVTPRVILLADVLVGSINIAPHQATHQGQDSIGYWIAREYWGRGIATASVALMLLEYTRRPIVATTSGHNLPSIRVLEKNGFVITSRELTPETARTVARETVTLMLS